MTFDNALKRIDELSKLKDGWSDEYSKAITKKTIYTTKSYIRSLDLSKYQIFPMVDGGIQIESEHEEHEILNHDIIFSIFDEYTYDIIFEEKINWLNNLRSEKLKRIMK